MTKRKSDEVRMFKATITEEVLFSARGDDEAVQAYGRQIRDAAMDGLGAQFPGLHFIKDVVQVVELTEAEQPVLNVTEVYNNLTEEQ